MRKLILMLSIFGIGAVQMSGAAETTFQPNNTLSHTNKTSSSDHVYTNDEISKAIDNLSAHAKQKEYRRASQAASDSLEDMKKWANQGNAEYQVRVGWIYYEGKGVRQDLVLARKMFHKAANQKNIKGQGMLGFFYEEGLGGLKRNRSTAKEWYGKTCDQGFQAGCDEYRRLNERGY